MKKIVIIVTLLLLTLMSDAQVSITTKSYGTLFYG